MSDPAVTDLDSFLHQAEQEIALSKKIEAEAK